MKHARLICMIALAGAVAIGCGTEEAGSAATGGAAAAGGTVATEKGGGTSEGACTNDEDTMVYDDLADMELTGPEVVSAIASACAFGSCSDEAENQAALADCVVACTEMVAPLTPDCLACYGDSVACSATNGCFSGFDTCSGL